MKLSELIAYVGDANVAVQNLDVSMVQIQTNNEGLSRVTFETNAINATQVASDSDKFGLILWLPRDKVREFHKAHERSPEEHRQPAGGADCADPQG